ncbi:hypothetical protein WJX75_003272 [Coccomyxa subellipsoidea]|uniref:Uncharacterized protein n=1 Tax=Coccomyxa subellipsoidea TaxID=248742 RepID=A0ABR2YR27_9CHLO
MPFCQYKQVCKCLAGLQLLFLCAVIVATESTTPQAIQSTPPTTTKVTVTDTSTQATTQSSTPTPILTTLPQGSTAFSGSRTRAFCSTYHEIAEPSCAAAAAVTTSHTCFALDFDSHIAA